MSESHLNPQSPPATRWPVLPLPGLTLDSLGSYLAAIGVLSVTARQWPSVRGCWRGEEFALVNGPEDLLSLVDMISDFAARRRWAKYDRSWDKTQKADTKNHTAMGTSRWRSERANEEELLIFDAHLALGERLRFNPLFGSGGNAGRRNFSAGWKKATTLLAEGTKAWTRQLLANDLEAFLRGEPCICLGDFSAGCWFSAANKTYNSGTAKPFREGQVTPWVMALACEAIPLLRGGASRQLGNHRRSVGAFPFVTSASAPDTSGEIGRYLAEVWAPVWHRPISFTEIGALFSRGRAEVRGRGATTPAEFSAAILQRGVDAGIEEFRRFTLQRTTSENTFESRLATVVPVRCQPDAAMAHAIDVALSLRNTLPRDEESGTRKRYIGLRGPIDRALIELAASPGAETSRALTDALVKALLNVDRNRSHRERNVRFQLLPGLWAKTLIGEHETLTAEIRLALAVASIRPTFTPPSASPRQVTAPMLAYWLGAENDGNWWAIRKAVPFRRVWGGGSLTANLCAVLQRRLVEERPDSAPPFEGWAQPRLSDVEAWFDGSLDEMEFTRWLLRFSLFAWEDTSCAEWRQRLADVQPVKIVSASLSLFALFKPLFDARMIRWRSFGAVKPAKVGFLSQITALLGRGDVNAAVEVARHAYHALGIELADFHAPFSVPRPDRLLAVLLIPVRASDVVPLINHWRSPEKLNQQKERYL